MNWFCIFFRYLKRINNKQKYKLLRPSCDILGGGKNTFKQHSNFPPSATCSGLEPPSVFFSPLGMIIWARIFAYCWEASLFIWKHVPPFRVKDKEWDDILYGKSQDTNKWYLIKTNTDKQRHCPACLFRLIIFVQTMSCMFSEMIDTR